MTANIKTIFRRNFGGDGYAYDTDCGDSFTGLNSDNGSHLSLIVDALLNLANSMFLRTLKFISLVMAPNPTLLLAPMFYKDETEFDIQKAAERARVDDDTIFEFKCAVNEFLKENTDNDKLIGVHCTYGLNRTGYLICRYLIDVQGMRPDDAIEIFKRCRGHCLERQNYTEDLQKDLIRRNRDSSVSRSSGFKDTTHMMEPVHTTIKSVNQGHWYNLHQTQGYPVPSQHFHSQTQDLQQSVRKFSQNQNIYQRGHIPPPGATGEDYSQRRYSWNVKPNASQGAQNAMWYPGSYYRLSCPTYCGWTE
ncbi:RNA/RNP complex-1-interacting phosphatase-like [Vulpes lagopus]|uniref:RNA/RNP complex-1-interacting phosphatase-like n=1 Tax=Vulpes lagopus TaxID=494514 RepID=UPI001BC90074|nr:RNA/RNP complex-1-interacting phosphatase-like [Vulpes lagopus]